MDGAITREICRLLEIDKLHTSVYKPSTNAQIERFHRSLNSMIGTVISDKQTDWDEWLPYVLAAYRASPHDSSGFSPHLLTFGRENRATLDIVFGLTVPEPEVEQNTYCDYVENMQTKLHTAYDLARDKLGHAAGRNKRQYDMKVKPALFAPGDWVYYYNPRRFTGRSEKWSRKYIGPMVIVQRLGPVNYLIQKSRNSLPFVEHID